MIFSMIEQEEDDL